MKRFFSLALALSAFAATTAFADAPTFSSAVSASLKTQVLSDLQFSSSLQGSDGTALYRYIFGDSLNGSNLSDFFSQRIYRFDLSDCGGGPGVAACAGPDNTMWITHNYIDFDMPQLYRVSAIFHESRHTEMENGNWPHVNCPTPFQDADGKDIKGIFSGTVLAGLPACDVTPYGAYALQAELLKNVQFYCTNCTDKVKADAELYGDDTVKRIVGRSAKQLQQDLRLTK